MGGALSHSALESGYWGLMIVTYPYISGLVAGSFIVSSLSHVFHRRVFDGLAPLAVLASLALLIAAPLTVLGDARQPSNVMELLTRDHLPYSPLATFILIWIAYIILMLFELYFAFRATNVRLAKDGTRHSRLHRVLALGSQDTSEHAVKRDRKAIFGLSCAGIALAFLFHGYIGFVFGATKARSLWATPLMPVLFIVSAIVSGIAFMWFVYTITMRYVGRKPDQKIMSALLTYLVLFLLLDFFLDLVDILTSAIPEYAPGATYYAFFHLMFHGPFTFSYLGMQLGVGILLPLILWLLPAVRRNWIGQAGISLAILIGVYAMRWNVVFGGQAESKVSPNTVVTNSVPWTGFDSVQTVLGVFAVALLLFLFFTWLFPWREAGDVKSLSGVPGSPAASENPLVSQGADKSSISERGMSPVSNEGSA